jgi:NDP-sugar pyrophosphorylase family protein
VKPTLVLMAAGIGSRFRDGVKQLAEVGPRGERLLDFAIFDARRAGFGRVVFIVRDEHQEEFRALGRRMSLGSDAVIAVQRLDDLPAGFAPGVRTKPWGTGHAVLAARGHIDGPFTVLNADDFYGTDAYRAAAEACVAAKDGITTIIGMRLDRTLSPHGAVTRGVCDTEGDRVVRLEEVQEIARHNGKIAGKSGGRRREFSGREVVSMNFWVFPAGVVEHLDRHFRSFLKNEGADHSAEFRLPDTVNALIESGHARVQAVDTPGPWFGLTFADDRPEVVSGLADLTNRGVYPSPLWP